MFIIISRPITDGKLNEDIESVEDIDCDNDDVVNEKIKYQSIIVPIISRCK